MFGISKEKYIFVSYNHRDKMSVKNIVKRLEEDGYRVWIDSGIQGGDIWNDTLAERIRKCTVFLGFMSYGYLRSTVCKEEIGCALENGCTIVMANLDRSLQYAQGELAERLREIQYIEMGGGSFRMEENIRKLESSNGFAACKVR